MADFDPADTHLSNGAASDPVNESNRYEDLISATGPVDLQLLGIGTDGHIGFNEPTSSFGSRTRLKTLIQSTIDANAKYLGPDQSPPKYTITVDIKTILESQKIILPATGGTKAATVADMIEGPMGAYCPATTLQQHPSATIVEEHAERSAEGSAWTKVMRPSQRKEMAPWAVRYKSASIRFACRTFSICETCYRYQPKLRGENELIADWLATWRWQLA